MIIALVGPKGAGKSTLGRMLHAPPDVVFLDVESIAQRVLAEVGGTIDERYAARVFEETVHALEGLTSRVVIVESTAASASTQAYFDALARVRPVRFVRVAAGEQTCAERITTRDQARHVAVPADLIRTMHRKSIAAVLPWSLELDNDPALSRAAVEQAFAPLLAEAGVDQAHTASRAR